MNLKLIKKQLKTIEDFSKVIENMETTKVNSLRETKIELLTTLKNKLNSSTSKEQRQQLKDNLNEKSIELALILSKLIKNKEPFFKRDLQEVKNNLTSLTQELKSNITKLQKEELDPIFKNDKQVNEMSLNMKTEVMDNFKFVEKILRETNNGWIVDESKRRDEIVVELRENLKLLKKLNELTTSIKITPKKEIKLLP